jgi:hypothetical protein
MKEYFGYRVTAYRTRMHPTRSLSATARRPQRRKPSAYLGQVCVAADGPVYVAALDQNPDAFSVCADANGSSTSVYVAPLEMRLLRSYEEHLHFGTCEDHLLLLLPRPHEKCLQLSGT